MGRRIFGKISLIGREKEQRNYRPAEDVVGEASESEISDDMLSGDGERVATALNGGDSGGIVGRVTGPPSFGTPAVAAFLLFFLVAEVKQVLDDKLVTSGRHLWSG